MHKVRLLLSYDGTQFCGWQSQVTYKNKSSVQTTLQEALTKIYKEAITCVPAGRTDAGVHASSQNVHFYVSKDPTKIPLLLALRTLLPPTISVRKAWVVPHSFAANKKALAKTYRYFLWNDTAPSALLARYTYWYTKDIHLETLQDYARLIVGRHDFKTFQSASGTPPKTSHRRIYKAQWKQIKHNLFVFEITGNGFLRQMVRNLVSTQLQFQNRKASPCEFKQILLAKNRRLIGKPAPAHGLFMSKVYYPSAVLEESQAFGERHKIDR